MSTKKTKTHVPQKLDDARSAFDYILRATMENIKNGKPCESQFLSIVFLPNEESFSIIPVPLGDTVDAEQRREVMRVVGDDLAEQGAEAMVFVTLAEAWVSKGGKYSSPKEDPKRREVFMASAQDKDGYVRNVSYEIKRKTSGIEFSRMNIFGKSQSKQSHEWVKDSKIENSLTIPAWENYKKKLKN